MNDKILLLFVLPNGLSIIICTLFLIFSIKKFKHKTFNEKLFPIKIVFITLLIFEIFKIYYSISSKQSYELGKVPIIYCSLILYLYPTILTAKKDSLPSRIALALSVFPEVVFAIVYTFYLPTYNESLTLNRFLFHLHSRFYHYCMTMVAIYIIVVNLYDFRFKDFLPVTSFVGLYFLFCTILSLLLGNNISLFGPTSEYVHHVYDIFGYATGNLLLYMVVFTLGFVIYGIIELIRQKKHKKYYISQKENN